MAELEILTFPNPVLHRICEEVKEIDSSLIKLIENMAETMYKNGGIGLAAPQVGILKRVIVFDVGKGLYCLINPLIQEEGSKEDSMEEGCLCLPGIKAEIKRKKNILVKGFDKQGKELTLEASDLLARVIQHEIDHLNGILFIDKLSRLKRDLLINKFKKKKPF